MRKFGTVAIVAMLVLSAPARAADPDSLACLVADIDPTVPRKLAGEMLEGIAKGGDAQPSDRAIEAIAGQAMTCKARHGWSDGEMEAAITYAIAIFTVPAAEGVLMRAGFDPATVTGAFRSMPAQTRARFQDDPIPDEAIAAYMLALEKAGIVPADETASGHVGLLAGLLSTAESAREKFVAD